MAVFTNTEMHMLLDTLNNCTHCTGLLGYGIARNIRLIQDASQDYLKIYGDALSRFGEVVETPTDVGFSKQFSINPSSPKFDEFISEVEPIAHVKHNVDVFCVPYSEAMNQLTAEQMLQLDWMLTDEQEEQECKD